MNKKEKMGKKKFKKPGLKKKLAAAKKAKEEAENGGAGVTAGDVKNALSKKNICFVYFMMFMVNI